MSKPEIAAHKLYNMLDCKDELIKAKGKAMHKKIKKMAKNGNPIAIAIIEYLGAIAKNEKGDRVLVGFYNKVHYAS